jgi:hypothetical protein
MILFVFLDYTLSNFETRVDHATGNIISFNKHEAILQFLMEHLAKPKFSLFHRIMCFIVVNSFWLLFSKMTAVDPGEIIFAVYSKMPPTWLRFMINQIHLHDAFPYSITNQSCRQLFSPVLLRLATSKSPPLGIPHEFLFCFMRGLMLEMKRVYSEYPAELPPMQKRLSDTFIAFGGLMSEVVQTLFDKLDSLDQLNFKTNHFIRLLGRWLMLLQPFTVLSRTAAEATAFLQPIFSRICERLTAWKVEIFPENAEDFSFGVALFLEIFSLYVDFVSSLLDGGEELKAASRYGWLIAATKQSHIQPSDMIHLLESIDQATPPKES